MCIVWRTSRYTNHGNARDYFNISGDAFSKLTREVFYSIRISFFDFHVVPNITTNYYQTPPTKLDKESGNASIARATPPSEFLLLLCSILTVEIVVYHPYGRSQLELSTASKILNYTILTIPTLNLTILTNNCQTTAIRL